MASRRDYYAILDLPHSADQNAIRRAYRRLAKRHHPDAGGDASGEDFRAVREAFETLSDAECRRHYDEATRTGTKVARPAGEPRSPVTEGQILLSREEAACGGLLDIEVPFRVVCPECGGEGGWLLACRACGGRGKIEGELPCTILVPPGVREGTILETDIDEPVPVTLRLAVGVSGS